MDAFLSPALQLWWSDALQVQSVEGPSQQVLRSDADSLRGQPLHQALGITATEAQELDGRSRSRSFESIFLHAQLAGQKVWLRLTPGMSGKQPSAAVLDIEAMLHGAPPLQISKLSSSLSHELRNPLSSIKMAVQTLARNPGHSERDQRRLVIANREVRTMERMLWLFSEYGRESTPMLEPASPKQLLEEAAALVQPELSERKIKLHLELPEGLLPTLRVDSNRLRPVLSQLFMNVAMGQDEGSELKLRISREGPWCQVVVQDPGATLPQEEQGKVFEPFATMLARGAGLSLAALHRVMVGHGGSVTAAVGAGGTGITYTLSFPI